jgi:branched-chain amino acid aminotransferase
MEIAARDGIQIEEKTISTNKLESLVSVFISGTSPKVLPVKQIDDFIFDVNHPLLRLLMDQFELLIQLSLKSL